MNDQPEIDPKVLAAARANHQRANVILDGLVRTFKEKVDGDSDTVTESARFIEEGLAAIWVSLSVADGDVEAVGQAKHKVVELTVALLAAAVGRLANSDLSDDVAHVLIGETAATAHMDQASSAARADINRFVGEYLEQLRQGESPDDLVQSLTAHAVHTTDLTRTHLALLHAQAIRMLAEERTAGQGDTP